MGYFLGKETLSIPLGGGDEDEVVPKNTPTKTGDPEAAIARCKAKCGGMVEPCFSICLAQEGPGTPDIPMNCTSGKACAGDYDCGGGKCVGGKCDCSGGTTSTGCPEGVGTAYEGCSCGEEYPTKTGKCVAGYQYEKHPFNDKGEGTIGLCVCQKALSEWQGKKGGSLGEYQYPAGLQELMTTLMERGKGFYGYDPAAIEAMFGRGFENVRGQEAGQREQLNRTLQSQGMLGTGTALQAGNELGFATEKNVNDLARDIMIKNEEQKRSDTELLSSILGRGMGFEQLLEAINSGRRGEGQNALAMLLSLLNLFKG